MRGRALGGFVVLAASVVAVLSALGLPAAGAARSPEATPAAGADGIAKRRPCKKGTRAVVVKRGTRKVVVCRKVPAKRKPAPKPRPRPRTPSPLTVAVTVDRAQAMTAQVTPQGGTATLAAADGSRYTLVVPPGAVLSDVSIELAPITAVAGLPLSGGLVAGVDVKPDGLVLLRPAQLTVDLPRPVPDGRRTGFAYRGDGRELHLYPIRGHASSAVFTVTHFSGYGIGDGTQADRSRQASTRPPTDPVDQSLQQTAAGPVPSAAHEASLLAPSYVVEGLLAGASTLDAAIGQYVAWRAVAQGFAGTYPALAARLVFLERQLPVRLRQHVRTFRAACAAGRDLAQVRQMLRVAGYVTVLPGLAEILPDVGAALDACVRFELDFTLTLEEKSVIEPSSATVRVEGLQLRARAPAAPPFVMELTGQKALEVVGYSVAPYECWSHTWAVSPAQPLTVQRLTFDLNLSGTAGGAATLDVAIDPGSLREAVTHVCGGDADSAYTDERNTYVSCFRTVHPDGRIGPWQYVGAGTWARGTLSAGGGDCTATTTFELRHTPAP